MALLPSSWTSYRPKLSFLFLHYTYFITVSLTGGVILYAQRNMPFVDALFFACGAATQSGLNTIDLNLLKLYQQVVLFIIPLITNPIFVSSAIVFVRIYWFEKRLENLVYEARFGRYKTTTRPRAEPSDADPEREERGVGGRPITLIRGAPPQSIRGTALPEGTAENNKPLSGNSTAVQSPESSKRNSAEIKPVENAENGNAQEVSDDLASNPEDSKENIGPTEQSPNAESAQENGQSTHIAFADSNRPPKKSGVLRIPSPREFEREGGTVQDIEEEECNPLRRSHTTGQISVTEETDQNNNQGKIRRRMGSITERIIPRAQTLAITSGFSRGRSTSPMSKLSRRTTRVDPGPMPYLSYTPTVGRNSAFPDLTEEQKDELGGLEYRALKLLAKILIGYMVFFQIFANICILPWIMNMHEYGNIIQDFGLNKVWWCIFTSNMAFNDVGFTLTPNSMLSFQHATWPVLLWTYLIIIGNTGFPCMLRLIIWVMKKCTPADSSLDAVCINCSHPRRCFTLLFPATATWWLFAILVILNAADMILFLLLDLKDPDVMTIPVSYRLLSGLFQAVSTRTAGFSIVNVAALHPAIQVSYMVMMYISIFPIAISVRRTNVYEESALGIYLVEEAGDEKKPTSFVGAHLRNQLQYDLWYVFLGLFLIAIVEGRRIESKADYAFTLFAILFEVVSAYGTVGVSLGYPDVNTSFCGQFKVLSKLIILAMQIRGRHRGLPYQVDRAILLPSESLLRDQRLNRRPSLVSTGLPLGRSVSQSTSRARPMTSTATDNHRD
ncbi:cation transport protein-domain-containing protein [Kalaharituber pfeilii]|nr:cation transport protein-domain-containing protein [Kalaharituber pfeilii]